MTDDVTVVCVSGPVGAGKSTLLERVVPRLREAGQAVGLVDRDIHPTDNSLFQESFDGVQSERTILVNRTADRSRIETFAEAHPELDTVIVEDVGGKYTTVDIAEFVDYYVVVISASEGENIPYTHRAQIEESDLLVLNKIDLAEHVDVDISAIERDFRSIHDGTFFFANSKSGEGVESIANHLGGVL